MVSTEAKNKIIENNNKISELLKENEKILVSEGMELPEENFVVENEHKIQIPSGYIRVNEVFQNKYHLKKCVKRTATQKNIAYTLQLSDFFNYILNRFNIWGSVETILYKTAIINLVSVFEALVFECANNICNSPDSCGFVRGCSKHFTKTQRNNSFEALKRMNELNITDFNEEEMNRIKEIIGFRNRVHIRLAEENEFINSDFSMLLYNEVIILLQRLSSCISGKGILLYDDCP